VRIGGKYSVEFRASGMFSAEGVQPAVATCSLGTVSISAGRHRWNTGETCVEMGNCRIFWMLEVKLKVKINITGYEVPDGSIGKLYVS